MAHHGYLGGVFDISDEIIRASGDDEVDILIQS